MGLLYPDISRPAVLVSRAMGGYTQKSFSSALDHPANTTARATARARSAGSRKKAAAALKMVGAGASVRKTRKPTQAAKTGIKKTIKKKPKKCGASVKNKPSTKRNLKSITYPFFA